MKSLAAHKWYPRVVFPPNNLDWATNFTKQRFDFRSIAFIGLRKLSVKAASPLISQPRCHKRCKIIAFYVVDDCTLNVCLHHRSVNVRRQARKRIDVPTDMIKKLRSPGAHGNNIHEHVAFKLTAMQQVCAKGRSTAHVMRNDLGLVQVPMSEHFSKDLTLNIQRGSSLRVHVGSTKSRHVVPVNAIVIC